MEANIEQKDNELVIKNLVFNSLQNKQAERHIHYNKD